MRYDVKDIGWDNFSKIDIDDPLTHFDAENDAQAIELFEVIYQSMKGINPAPDRKRVVMTDEGYILQIGKIKLKFISPSMHGGSLHLVKEGKVIARKP